MPQRPPDVTPEILQGDLTRSSSRPTSPRPELAVDTETMGLVTLRDRLCVVQLCDRTGRASLVQIPRADPRPARVPRRSARRVSSGSSRTRG